MLSKTANYRRCLYFNECGIEEYHNGRKWKYLWYKYNKGLLCNRHRLKLIWNPTRTKEYRKKYNDKRNIIFFLGKQIRLSFRLRKGICKSCGKKEGE